MYIPEFWCGVLSTIAVEFITIIIWGIYQNTKKEGGNDGKEES